METSLAQQADLTPEEFEKLACERTIPSDPRDAFPARPQD
jgi:hypothetical protein